MATTTAALAGGETPVLNYTDICSLFFCKALWREKAAMTSTTCWQYLIKRELRNRGGGYPLRISPDLTEIRRIDLATAGSFILNYEWLGNMGRSKYAYGLYARNELLAVACFGPLVSVTHFTSMLRLKSSGQILQLCRGASSPRAPKWAPSKLIGAALRLLARATDAIGVVAYADPHAGELGTIYQATNAIYLGMTNPGGSRRYYIHRHWYDPRRVQAKFGSRAAPHLRTIDPDFKSVPIFPKHRYFWPVGGSLRRRALRRAIAHLVLPYPKRPKALPLKADMPTSVTKAICRAAANQNRHFAPHRPAASTRLGYAPKFKPTHAQLAP